ncbi:Protein of unknown function DUF4188 [Ceraceosorus bombacis]|uniref:Uncharacterized protein n=1 Tax=Ceraceosorus bombacis TaxID=401625 RepID=A0A0P1BSI2_9BASI|nr:Protein of unknown function DUF4188 [Ceraceosorus bombacis]
MRNVIAGKFTNQFPNRTTAQWGEDEALDESDNTAANGVVCVQELEDEQDNGFIGASSFNETERSSNNTLMTAFYFTDYEKLDRWTRASAHGSAIKWWDEGVKQGKYKHLTIAHELYRVPRGHFESVYVNSALLGLSSTSVKTDHGWVRPVVDASIGPLRTSRGRQAGIQASSDSPGKNDKASIYPRATAPPGFVSP